MFNFLKKESNNIPYTDKVWKTAEAANKGILMMAMMRLQQGKSCLLITFFESDLNQLTVFMDEHQLRYIRLDGLEQTEPQGQTIYVVHSPSLFQSNIADFLKKNKASFSDEAFFVGHYPLSLPELKVLQQLKTLNFGSFVFCLSFDDPLMKIFGAQNILSLLEKIGLEEEEAVEHAMVTKAIRRAIEQVDKKVSLEKSARSPVEWFSINIKN